ncbi:acyl-CoA dehydrogenase family protein [Sphingobium sp. EM0848]|uniref:acyl-CoA dehydrogenase family protein n=1 Tax=Sphingobium sp. EM0848 TaxID=2743473 RepID=UPI00159C89DE|nr:acyl-CoA dehydrogenase family protein [Sphingobium sp. EM0848]
MARASESLAAQGWVVPRRTLVPALDGLLPDETLAVRTQARDFADRVLAPLAHQLNTTPERRDGFRRDVFDAIAGAGLYAVPFAPDIGGRGLASPTLATITVLEELAYYTPGVASAMYDAQILLAGKVLDMAGGRLRETYLPQIVRGEIVASFATSEPEASTDLSLASIQTLAEPVEGGWRVNGRKRWITNSPAADRILLLCRTGEGLSILLADMRAPGVSVGDPDLKMGNHAQLTADIEFRDVFVPADHVVGAVGGGLRAALGALALGRIGIGVVGVAMAQRALDIAAAYTSERTVYGKAIAANQYWQYRFAEHATEIEAARALCQRAAQLVDQTGDAGALAAMAKVKGSALAVDVARDAVQACGGYGFVRELAGANQHWPLEALYRDAKVGEIYEGANEVQKWIIARHIFGRNITG